MATRHRELDALRAELDGCSRRGAAGFGSYIDVHMARTIALLRRFTFRNKCCIASPGACPRSERTYAMLDCIIRPAMVDLTGPQEGFAVSLYVKALGHDAQAAEENWASALDAIVALLRSKDLAFS
jgi:hypothetical protein